MINAINHLTALIYMILAILKQHLMWETLIYWWWDLMKYEVDFPDANKTNSPSYLESSGTSQDAVSKELDVVVHKDHRRFMRGHDHLRG